MAVTAERHREYELERYRARRAEAIAFLGGRCVTCDVTTDLEFDHIDPNAKTMSISAMWSVSYDRFMAELQLCQLLCGPHHREKTRIEQEARTPPKHNRWRYMKHKCRCDECKADYSVYRRGRYAANK